MIGVKFVEFALPILQWGNNIRQMLYSMRRGWLCTPLSNRTVWRTKVPVNGSAVLARPGQVMEYANLGETDPIIPIAVL
jgi:hypothetical protein